MTIKRNRGDLVFFCDTCEDELETHTDDWADALSMAKSEGWHMKKIGKDWLHGCPNCGVD